MAYLCIISLQDSRFSLLWCLNKLFCPPFPEVRETLLISIQRIKT